MGRYIWLPMEFRSGTSFRREVCLSWRYGAFFAIGPGCIVSPSGTIDPNVLVVLVTNVLVILVTNVLVLVTR